MMSVDGHSECCYFDAVEDCDCSVASTSYESGEEEFLNCGNVVDGNGYCPYDVWMRSPMSVEERRKLFRKWLGWGLVSGDEKLESEGGLIESSGGDLRTCSLSQVDDSYLPWSSMLPCLDSLNKSSCVDTSREMDGCKIRSSGDTDESIVEDLKPNTQVESSGTRMVHDSSRLVRRLRSLSRSFSLETKVNRNDKLADAVDSIKGNKNKWLRRLRSFTCTMDSPVKLDSVERSIIKCSCKCNAPRFQRVKVQHCRKKIKELSALYTVQEISAHRGSILTMKFSPDGQFLASAGEDMIVRVWQVFEEDRSITVDLPDLDLSCLYFTVNHLSDLAPLFADKEGLEKPQLLKKSTDSACVIFPPKVFHLSEKPLHEFIGHNGAVLDLSWSDKNHLLSSSDDNTIRLWRVGSDHCHQVFSHSNYVTCVQFNPVNDDHFISGCLDGKVRMWSVSRCQVVDWIDVKELVTAICYSPDAQGGIVGTIEGNCHFLNISDNLFQRGSCIQLHGKKKSPFKKITGFQFLPHDNTKVMVTSADSKIRIMDGLNVIKKYKGPRSSGYTTASLTTEGKHIVATCEDTHVYVWNGKTDEEPTGSPAKNIGSCEHFSANASVAIPWEGLKVSKMDAEKRTSILVGDKSSSLPFAIPARFCVKHGYLLNSFPRGTATWPEESLPASSSLFSKSSSMRKSHYKLFKSSCQSTCKSHAWGLVIVAGGWDGRIRSFHNYGLPVVT